MSVDLERHLRELAGDPSRSFDVDAALRGARRRRAVHVTGAATSVVAVAVAATLALGGTRPSIPVVDDHDPDVAAPADRPGTSEVVGDGGFVVVLTPRTGNILTDLEARAREQALDAIIAGDPTPRWRDLAVDVQAVDADLRPLVEEHHRLLTSPTRGDHPIVPDDERSLLGDLRRRVLQELPAADPPFDVSVLRGPADAGDRELAWYMSEDRPGEFDDARIELQLGPVLDDLCGWLGDRHADADARFREVVASSGRFETSYGLPPLQLHEALPPLGASPVGDGLSGWIDERCSHAFPAFEPWPEGEAFEEERRPPEVDGPERAEVDRSEEAVAAALRHKPAILGDPRDAGTGLVFGYGDGREQPANQEGIAVFLVTYRPGDGGDGGGRFVTALAPWEQFERLATEQDGWPPGSLVGLSGPPGNARQVVLHVDGTIVNLSADDEGAVGVLEGWARDVAWDLHAGGEPA